MPIRNFEELRQRARSLGPKRVAVVCAEDEIALVAAAAALECGIALPVLIGNPLAVRALALRLGLAELLDRASFADGGEHPAATAVQWVRDGAARILLKGRLRTDELLRAVLRKDGGLRTGRLLSDVLLFEYCGRLVGVTDGGLNVAPGLPQKIEIVRNAVEVMRSLGLARPKIAVMSATEAVTASVPSTLDAQALAEAGAAGVFGDAEVFGPLAVDNALMESAAIAKGIAGPVAGHADCLVAPNIEAANMFGKASKYLGGSECAHVIAGAAAPILIPSRVESAADKLNSIALGVVYDTP